jgi:hypothetical protein
MNPMEALMPTHAAITKTPALRIAVVHEDPAWTFDALVARVVDFQNRKFPRPDTRAGVLAHRGATRSSELRANPRGRRRNGPIVLILFIAAPVSQRLHARPTNSSPSRTRRVDKNNETRTWPDQPDARRRASPR